MKNKFIKISLLCIAVVLMIITFYQIAEYEAINVSAKEYNPKALNPDIGTILEDEPDPASYSYNIAKGDATYADGDGKMNWIRYDEDGESYAWIPEIKLSNGKFYPLFCTEPGQHLDGFYNFATMAGVNVDGYLENGQKHEYTKKDADFTKTDKADKHAFTNKNEPLYKWFYDVPDKEEVPEETFTQTFPLILRCTNNEHDLPVAAAYIVSESPAGKWNIKKQRALWHLYNQGIDHLYNQGIDERLITWVNEGSQYDKDQPKYDQEVMNYYNYDNSVRGEGLNPKDNTNPNEVSIELNGDTYTVGPFNITYTNGIYGDVAFAGISNIKVIGYKSDGSEVEELKLGGIILKDVETEEYGTATTPNYFNPDPDLKVDRNKQIYPKSGQDFKLTFTNPNTDASDANKIVSIKVQVEFKYMLANGKYCEVETSKPFVTLVHTHTPNDKNDNSKGQTCVGTFTRHDAEAQDLISTDAIRTLYTQKLTIEPTRKKAISLGGYVWEDVPSGKENIANGIKDANDRPISNVKVTLHTSDGSAVTLADPKEEGITDEQIMHRVNPTYTDANGKYLFEGVDPDKKYYVTFEYNGQTYLPTNYNTSNTEQWRFTSKGTEKVADRTNYNNKFKEIGSSPLNYESSNSLNSGKLVRKDGKYYNETFSQFELMGFVLDKDGNYQPIGTKLVDGFYELKNGNIVETNTIQEGVISKKIKEYIIKYKKSPDADAMKKIYKDIAGDNTELWRKLQFIEDCKIKSYTQAQGANEYDLYSKNGNEELYINQGLWRRQEVDLSLRKDVAYATVKINGTTQIYEYNNRGNEGYWEIQLRMRNYGHYYASTYTREISPADYSYRAPAENPGAELDLYVTYKITVKNNSTSVLSQIREIVDYYDKDYTYMNNLSWVMYKQNSSDDNSAITLKEEDFFNTMDKLRMQGDLKKSAKRTNSGYSTTQNSKGTYTGSSRYGAESQQDLENSYNSIYVRGLSGKKLASGEEAYVYLTFKVNKDSNGIILDNDDSLKQNYSEINGYSTYYKDGTKLPNNQTMSSTTTPGLIDVNSNPGNLKLSDTQGYKPERNFEDDTDRAKSIKVTSSNELIRSINGTVWEDERTYNVAGAMIGDGVRQDTELGIKGVTVELIEKLPNGKERTVARTTTGDNGRYEFKADAEGKFYIIPSTYIVRFYYGDTDATVLTSKDGGSNLTSYNGQDFKCTVYQKDMETSETINQNDGKYDFVAADALGKNVSDAKDIWGTNTTKGTRAYVDYYSSNKENGVTNNLAEVLASPYASTVNKDLIKELRENTYMTAETDLIEFGTGAGSAGQSNYTVNNLDFGLTERPKAQLELNQKVTNVKVTLANGDILTKGTTNLSWAPEAPYELNKNMTDNKYNQYYGTDHRYAYRTQISESLNNIYKNGGNGLINVTMDEEVMHGATIEISYEMFIANVGETDYTGQDFYYNGTGATENRKVTTKANTVLNYVSNNLQYREDDNNGKGWKIVKVEELTNDDDTKVNERLVNKDQIENLKKFNTILQTTKLDQELKPGKTTETVSLVLTQLITPQNTSDDKTYTNIAEITNISNTVGRRMAFSVQGNQDPTANPTEIDSAQAERVVILPPFGVGEIILYVTVAIAGLAILIVGIIFIKKKVLKK